MELYESSVGMANLTKDGDRLNWWRNHEKQLPLLSKVARQVLGVPCSSAKSERVSTGGFMVTKRRNRLGSARVESLLVLKENKKRVDEFHKKKC